MIYNVKGAMNPVIHDAFVLSQIIMLCAVVYLRPLKSVPAGSPAAIL